MRFRLYLATLLITESMFNIPVNGIAECGMKISGRLVRVDVSGGIIYVMHDSRVVKFRASKEICVNFKEKIHSFVEIEYSKCGVKGFCIDTMNIIPGESSEDGDSSVLKSEMMINAICID